MKLFGRLLKGFVKFIFRTLKNPIILLILLLATAIGIGYYSHSQYQKTKAELDKYREDPRKLTAEESKRIVGDVGKLITLPTGEEPTIATVTDKEKLKDQAFFAKAENGDRVLIYTQARRAILYRPSINKVIDVAPINIGPTGIATPSATPTKTFAPPPTQTPTPTKAP